jgi:transcriptional regulator with XRE-family HTH domain
MTQRELADILGVERSSIAKWESGSAYPRAAQLPALAKALSCSIDELYNGEEAK